MSTVAPDEWRIDPDGDGHADRIVRVSSGLVLVECHGLRNEVHLKWRPSGQVETWRVKP